MNDRNNYYYTGGLAELVPNPSPLTYSFLVHWFTGRNSVGKAMRLLGLPHMPSDEPLLVLNDSDLVVDGQTEAQALYANTLFSYTSSDTIQHTPKLILDYSKVLHLQHWKPTIQILLRQSNWIAKPDAAVKHAQKLLGSIPTVTTTKDIHALDDILGNDVWPRVIAIGLLCEFFSHLYKNQRDSSFTSKDWFLLSLVDQYEVKEHRRTFQDYIHEYGLRADKDYDLATPRWYEIPEVIQKRIQSSQALAANETKQAEENDQTRTLGELMMIRMEAKKKALFFIDALRQSIIKTLKTDDIGSHTREALYGEKKKASKEHIESPPVSLPLVNSGKGTGISAGKSTGLALKNVKSTSSIPEGAICIFPNASPEFSHQFPKCAGIVFLTGGRTSHGAIVAREYGIPAVIDAQAKGIADGAMVTIDGTTGEWSVTV